MRKHDEGYTLPFVLVVFIIISLVAVSILTVAVHNLHGQKISVQRMEAQYAAQGEIEKVMAKLESQITTYTGGSGATTEHLTVGVSVIKDACNTNAQTPKVIFLEEKLEEVKADATGKVNALVFRLVSAVDQIQIEATVKITGDIKKDAAVSGAYTVDNVNIGYDAYIISEIESATEESTGGA